MKTVLFLLSLLVVAPCAAQEQIAGVCGSLTNPEYGPYDYRTSQKQLVKVNHSHFTPDVEILRHGNRGYLGGDLDYTLRASPNHHRALQSIARYAEINKTDRIPHARYTVACYFARALQFAPDDAIVHMIYGTYLFNKGETQKALSEYKTAEELSKDNANLHYNLGLVYFDVKEYDKALEHAWFAYSHGFTLPGLKAKLVAAGKWRDPPGHSSGGAPQVPKPK